MSFTPGAQCGGYEILGLLGTGGMGEVYRARDSKLGRQVAIKVLGVEALANPGAVRRFQHEARAASGLNHPGIVTIHDVGELDGQFFIVMELVEGATLRQLLGRGRAPLKETLQIASQMADALAKAHEAGIVHCDLKPENAMLTDEGHVKIVDFGLAKLTDPAGGGPAAAAGADGDRTTERIVFGTVGYMSPEQATGGTADFRTDQFAFGAILYEMATGRRAFHKDTGAETLTMIIRDEPERPLDLNPSLPLPLVWIIERCLSKDPADRYVSTRDLARDVQMLREHTTSGGYARVRDVTITGLRVINFAGTGIFGFHTRYLKVSGVVAINNSAYGVASFDGIGTIFTGNSVSAATGRRTS
jgi:eukaryotic-like serine/threonine-protein kinase